MRSVKLTIARFLSLFFLTLGLQQTAFSQENSPYSRYGLGDIAPNRNIFSRSMGGISAGVVDYQSINNTNPAALASLSTTIFDVGGEVTYRTLRSTNPAKKFTSANTIFSYLQMGFPLTSAKMYKKDMRWALGFGLRPVTRVNYKIEKNERTPIDSLNTLYEGSGGLNQAYLGTAFKFKGFSVGVNAGYTFGNKEYSTKVNFINDSVIYYISNSATKTSMTGLFANVGVQYETIFNKDKVGEVPRVLRVGAYANLQPKLSAKRDDIRETISYDAAGGTYRIDSIFVQNDVKGKVTYPTTVGVGFSYQSSNWMYGADFETTNWSSYRYYGQKDAVQNSWTVRVGTQYYPARINTASKKYFRFVKYRAGFFYGSDYVKVNSSRSEYAFTLGAGLPLTSLQRISYTGEYVVLNTGVELGSRGKTGNGNLRENVFRFNIGISMNARWFQKPKYN